MSSHSRVDLFCLSCDVNSRGNRAGGGRKGLKVGGLEEGPEQSPAVLVGNVSALAPRKRAGNILEYAAKRVRPTTIPGVSAAPRRNRLFCGVDPVNKSYDSIS